MQQYHGQKKTRKGTGAKFSSHSDKKLHRIGGYFSATKVSEEGEGVKRRRRGGSKKNVPLYAAYANVVMPDKSIQKSKIKSVVESPNNQHFTRMNIVTKGVVIETEAGKARVTSRPGQDGVVNAVLMKE